MTDPTKITTLKGWTDYLEELLSEAAKASGSGEAKKMQDVQKKLLEFEDLSPMSAEQLDNIALKAVCQLDSDNVTERLEKLENLTEEYRRILKLVGVIASESKNP